MNFIAGFLFLAFEKSESLAFAVLKAVIARYRMQELFNTELPMLKLHFYELDRLIAILLPDLHTHFKEETINSSYYSSSNFITLFTSVLQMQTSSENAENLLRLWDHFLAKGWKSIFKASIAILKENEEALLGMPFEVMLTQVVNLPTKFLITPEKDVLKFDAALKQVRVPSMLLERLKKEFDTNFKLSGVIQAERGRV